MRPALNPAGAAPTAPAVPPTRALTGLLRAHGPALLAGTPEPHHELMALVWGPRFDREHGLQLLVRQPRASGHTLPALLAAAEHFDQLPGPAQQHLRRLILRHRALQARPAESDRPGRPQGENAPPCPVYC